MIAFVREVPGELGEKSPNARSPANAKALRKQIGRVVTFLKEAGLAVEVFPALGGSEQNMKVGDLALLLPETAVIGRPVDADRFSEINSITAVLGQHRPVQSIVDPGTLEAADVLKVGRTIYVAETARTNADGIAQLRDVVGSHGYNLRVLSLTGAVSLRNACSFIQPHFVLVNPALVDPGAFENVIAIPVDEGEPQATRTVTVGRATIVAASAPKTEKRLKEAGIATVPLDISEFEKMDAGLSSLVLLLEPRPTNHSTPEFGITPVRANDVPLVDRHASQAVAHGGLVFTSQVLPFDPPAGRAPRVSLEEQVEQMVRNLGLVLSASGSSLEGIVRITLHVADAKHLPRIDAVWPRVFGYHRPARAVVANGALPPGVLVSIEAVAAQNRPTEEINHPAAGRAVDVA